MNFSTLNNLLKYQDKNDIGTVFAYGLIFPFAPPVASEAPSKTPSPSGTATQLLLHLLLLLIASVTSTQSVSIPVPKIPLPFFLKEAIVAVYGQKGLELVMGSSWSDRFDIDLLINF